MEKKQVLDRGYVALRDSMGTDFTPADVARVSFDKRASEFSDERNAGLINYLFKNNELACVRHNVMSFELYMPLMVARQIYKYAVGSSFKEDSHGWNESSRRYLTEEPEFYFPDFDQWRSSPENKKQGSGEPLDKVAGEELTNNLIELVNQAENFYEDAIDKGVAVEQARLFLPSYGMYVRCYWTASLNAILHFLGERLAHNAQSEIRDYAEAVREIVEETYPIIYNAWENNK